MEELDQGVEHSRPKTRRSYQCDGAKQLKSIDLLFASKNMNRNKRISSIFYKILIVLC